MRLEYFQLIDRIVDIDLAEQKIRAEATIPTTSTIFEGHFPGFPLMPGVLLVETMAQASGWLVLAANRFQRMPFLAAVKDAKFRIFAKPGQTLLVNATLSHEGSGYSVAAANITVDDKTICDANVTFRITDFPNDEMKLHMRKIAVQIGFPAKGLTDG
jgi:3-hydroxyacyl-[acyl-carrier-protein] dehydratase